MLLPFVKLTNVDTPIFPLILAHTFGFSLLISACKDVSVCKYIRALAMLETISPLAFISISILPLMNTVSVSFALLPLAYVGVTKNAFPNSLAFFEA
jgi:hypothetical protein